MLKVKKLKHHFIRNIPRELDTGVLYISMEYATAIHSCCCGCGEQVVTPFSPTDWKMIYDGESVSLTPSVGNWNYACRSHYIIKQNVVIEAGSWSETQITAERKRDKAAKANYYRSISESMDKVNKNYPEVKDILKKPSVEKGFWESLFELLKKIIHKY